MVLPRSSQGPLCNTPASGLHFHRNGELPTTPPLPPPSDGLGGQERPSLLLFSCLASPIDKTKPSFLCPVSTLPDLLQETYPPSTSPPFSSPQHPYRRRGCFVGPPCLEKRKHWISLPHLLCSSLLPPSLCPSPSSLCHVFMYSKRDPLISQGQSHYRKQVGHHARKHPPSELRG